MNKEISWKIFASINLFLAFVLMGESLVGGPLQPMGLFLFGFGIIELVNALGCGLEARKIKWQRL